MSNPDEKDVEKFATTLAHLVRTIRAARRRMPRVHPAVEPLSYPVLYAAAGDPVRVSVLATRTFSDVSTVSRQVSELASHGLLDKTSDPEDGRAQLISLSTSGQHLLDQLNAQRDEYFTTCLSDWDARELDTLTASLQRLAGAIEQQENA